MQSNQCISCKHFIGGTFCKAFLPKPIPGKIQQGWIVHNKAIEGDNGIVYERSEHYQSIDDKEIQPV